MRDLSDSLVFQQGRRALPDKDELHDWTDGNLHARHINHTAMLPGRVLVGLRPTIFDTYSARFNLLIIAFSGSSHVSEKACNAIFRPYSGTRPEGPAALTALKSSDVVHVPLWDHS